MKVLLLSDPNSSHTIKWAKSLSQKGIDIAIFGIGSLKVNTYKDIKNIQIYTLNKSIDKNEGALSKIRYLGAIPKIKKIIKEFKPDLVHAHYASSYGLLGALSDFHPFVLSVWGSDVFSFPLKSPLHKFILKNNLKKADKILSTSHVMARQTKLYTPKDITVTPFGIDLNSFKPMHTKNELFDENDIVIGTIKTLEEKYGIEYLIKAFKILVDKFPNLPLKLLIVGGGSLEKSLKNLALELNLNDKVTFTGAVPYEQVIKYHNMLSVSVSISDSESFGVAIIEASACEKPVVVSSVGGLPEVVQDGVTGIVVPPKNPQQTAQAIEKIIMDKNLMSQMGKDGRIRVKNLYNWDENLAQMIDIYKGLIK
ncbi:MAG: glycosyltransferase [Campylobacter sp.]|nr:glycosyltransferase [Campylobacter sp.]